MYSTNGSVLIQTSLSGTNNKRTIGLKNTKGTHTINAIFDNALRVFMVVKNINPYFISSPAPSLAKLPSPSLNTQVDSYAPKT